MGNIESSVRLILHCFYPTYKQKRGAHDAPLFIAYDSTKFDELWQMTTIVGNMGNNLSKIVKMYLQKRMACDRLLSINQCFYTPLA